MFIQTKKYLVLDLISNPTYNEFTDTFLKIIKPRIVTGFLRSDVKEVLSINSNWEPKDNEKIYFFPGCTVPRFKVRDKYAVTIKPENATVAFVNPKNLIGSDTTFEYFKNLLPISRDELQNIVNAYIDFDRKLLLNSLMQIPIEQTFLTVEFYDTYRYYNKIFKLNGENTYVNKLLDGDTPLYTRINESFKESNQLLGCLPNSEINKLTCNIYLQDDILKRLNEGNLIITEEKYLELQAFGKTNDKDNRVLMMELMANSNFEKSIFYLLLLLKEFGKHIYDYKEVDHVNFKSLLNFLDLTKKDIEFSSNLHINKITAILQKHKKFTKENAILLGQLCASDSLTDSDNSCWQPGYVIKPELYYLLDKPENNDTN